MILGDGPGMGARAVTPVWEAIMQKLCTAVLGVMSVLVAMSLATIANARTLSVIGLRPNDPNDPDSCYRWFPSGVGASTSGMQRVCSGTFAVDIALPVDTAGDKSIIVWGSRPKTTSQLSCNAWTVTSDGAFTPGQVISLTAAPSNSFSPIMLPITTVPDGGTLWIRCLMSQGVRLMSIDFVDP
jgi:hypothetical protein